MNVLADARVVNCLAAAARPDNLDAIHRYGGTQAEMEGRGVLRQKRSLATCGLHADVSRVFQQPRLFATARDWYAPLYNPLTNAESDSRRAR